MTTMLRAVFFFFLLGVPFAFADEEAAFREIRRVYEKIIGGKPVKTEKIKFELEPEPMGGTITRREYEGGLTAVTLSYHAGDHGGADEHFYFNKNGLFFIFVEDEYGRFDSGGTPEKPVTRDTLVERRYYVRDGECIRSLSREASGRDGKELSKLIARVENKPEEPGERFQRLLKRPAALRKMTNSKEAIAFFEKEE